MNFLHHRPQRHLYGCMYHALHALTGDESWLEHVDDLSEVRWLARLHADGVIVRTYFADVVTDTCTSPAFWDALRANIPPQGPDGATTHMPLLVTVEGLSAQRHLVTLALPVEGRDDVLVSDSALPALQSLSYIDFLSGRYARASEVQHLLPADAALYPHESGAEYLSRTDASLYAL